MRRAAGIPTGVLLALVIACGCVCEPPSTLGELGRFRFTPAPGPIYAQGSALRLQVSHQDGSRPHSVIPVSSNERVLTVVDASNSAGFEVLVTTRERGRAALEIHGELLMTTLDRLTLEVAPVDAFVFPDVGDPSSPMRLRVGERERVFVAAVDDRGRALAGSPALSTTVLGSAIAASTTPRLNRQIVVDALDLGYGEMVVRDPITGTIGTLGFLVAGDLDAEVTWLAEDGWIVDGDTLRSFTELAVHLRDDDGHLPDAAVCWFEVDTPEAFETEAGPTPCRLRLWWLPGATYATVRIDELRSGRSVVVALDAPRL